MNSRRGGGSIRLGLTGCSTFLAAGLLTGCGGERAAPPLPTPPIAPVVGEPEPVRFVLAATYELAEAGVSHRFSGGLATGDIEGDGDVDFVSTAGDAAGLYRNRGDGTFEVETRALRLRGESALAGPALGDTDGDGDLDLFVGAADGPIHVFENRLGEAEGGFVDVAATAIGALTAPHTPAATFYDYDTDGFLDLVLAHWGAERRPGEDTETLWRNDGDGTFTSGALAAGVAAPMAPHGVDWSLTPSFADIDSDGDGDLLVAADFWESRVLINGDGTFTDVTRDAIAEQRGRASALGDYDNDGDIDWFLAADRGRLFRNDGSGAFVATGTDISSAPASAACAADFDRDGWLDIAQVGEAGLGLLHNAGEGSRFRERTVATSPGRALACFDADGDFDVDLVVVDQDGVVAHYRNESEPGNRGLIVRLDGADANRFGVGARITVSTATGTQFRELAGRNNHASHDPPEAHFGLGTSVSADVSVRWPDGSVTSREDVATDQVVTLAQPRGAAVRLSVVQGGGDGAYAVGEEVAIEAAPAEEDYHFSHWSSNRGGVFADVFSATTTFRMPARPTTLIANYTPGVALSDRVSVARRWNEVLLQAIRNDYARPTVHARNLFHVSAAMYDAWAAHSPVAVPYLGDCAQPVAAEDPLEVQAAREEAMSFAAYRIIRHRFRRSPGSARIGRDGFVLMDALGYDVDDTRSDAAALGTRIAECYIAFGASDGANEANDYANVSYRPVNPGLEPARPGNPALVDLNRWQPLLLELFIDQAGNPIATAPEFLSPEWGIVTPFALSMDDAVDYERDGFTYRVYHDPGPPPTIDGDGADLYKWAHALVAVWSADLAPTDGETMDISPASLGNVAGYPTSFAAYPEFYGSFERHSGTGYSTNPITGTAYEPQVVPRGDYTRVLAEFWADGPDSETPPGHWFVITNEVADHPLLERRFAGTGEELDRLEWDAKAYFALGGAMHDAAIAAWGIKGWYDYIRPISSLRAMADRGQSTDPGGPSYHVRGLPLVPGRIGVVGPEDDLAGAAKEHVGKIKVFAWRGPDYIEDPATDEAGVGWILAENWWPYQRPTFVTPPFAGYVSGHSTYSRAAAEVLAALTGDPYFPGGMSGFEIEANEFLVFEDGPSVDMTLQWASYRDAADQCSLSRIWGGIHPPVDDIPGRLIGIDIGRDAFALAQGYFTGSVR
ncbi:MAG: FG-GAP-like repeat-containing protein [Gammaproteobacteria bacterium]|nr:FG-GAP-like repeat-containing protein [Gammaproteobacteria bacterium]